MAAAAGSPVQSLCDEAKCSICLDYFKEPVTIPKCSHNFCRACLNQCWQVGGIQVSCPQCRETVPRRRLIPNRQLANVVEIAKQLSLQLGREEGGKERVCEEHQEPLKLFCKEDEAPICVVCDRSKEHRHHEVVPLKEASQEYKGMICSRLDILREERETFLSYQADLQKESQDLLRLTETEKRKVVEKFKRLRHFLREREKQLLNEIEETEKEIAGRRDEQVARLSRDLSSLERIIQEMEERRQKPAAELLQDVRSSLQRYEKRERLGNPLAFPPELKKKTSGFCDITALLESASKQLKDTLLLRQEFQKANVTLDPDTAHRRLILSQDRKSVIRGDQDQDLPNNPERFKAWPCVLGREEFTAGRHFWEVTVGGEVGWAVGVARKSVGRKGIFLFGTKGGVWAVGKWEGEYLACTPPSPSPLSLSWELRRIRVDLDYEGGSVSFSDAESGAELYTFSGACFYGESLLPFIRLWGNKTHLSVS